MKVEAIVRNCARFGKSLLVGALVLSAIACSSDHKALLHYNANSTVNPLGPVDPSSSSSSPGASLIENGGVEDGVDPWRYQGDGMSISQSAAQAHAGDFSLWVTGRSANWHAAVMDLPRDLTVGRTYYASVWVRLHEGEEDTVVAFTLNRKDDTEGQGVNGAFTKIMSATATDDSWVQLRGSFEHEAVGQLRDLYLYIEAESLDASFYVDDLELTPVGGLAFGHDKFLGNVIDSAVPDSFRLYWNQVTVENGGKWGSVEVIRDTMNWNTLDVAYNFAKANNMPFKLHTLVWDNQTPAWIDNLSPDEQREEVEEWIRLLAERYPDVEMIDVVNEPISAPASYRGALGGEGDTGWDWVIWSFEMAREYFPEADLHLNEYGILASPENKIEPYLDLIELLDDRGLIDGIGVQAHYFTVDNLPAATIRNSLDRLGATGVPIYISELDFSGTDQQQRDRFVEKFPVFWGHPDVAGVTLWGYIEGQAWENLPGLVRANGTERPAMQWLRSYLGN